MAEEKVGLLSSEEPKGNPPSYDNTAIPPHGELPVRSTHQRQPSGRMLPRGPLPLELPVLNHLKDKRVILASASPRRRQILSLVCVVSGIVSANILNSDRSSLRWK